MPPSPISPLNKGLGFLETPLDSSRVAQCGWNLLREEISLPAAVLDQEKIRHNLAWMQSFIQSYGVRLAPHGKTTMAPKLFAMQISGGAWGITLATAHQTRVAYEHGIRRVFMANQLVGRENMATIERLLQDKSFEFFCLVDSAALVDQLGRFFSSQQASLRVLLEIGVPGGRTGVRDEEQLQSVLQALDRWKGTILLSGIELYEGVLDNEDAIRAFLDRAVSLTRRLAAEKRFQHSPILLSGAGSAWYDVVADVFSAAKFADAVEILLRPGCYLTHDVGIYRAAQSRIMQNNPVARQMNSSLLPALQIWAYVQSVPESERAIIAMGKRDAAFDAGLPVPALRYRSGDSAPGPVPAHWKLTKMMDQHAYLQIASGDDIQVGDIIVFDISHPCLTFDKWRTLAVVDAGYQVVDIVQTYF